MNYQTASRDALIERVRHLEGILGEILFEVRDLYGDAEGDLLADTGNDYQFDCGRYDGLQDAVTSIEVICHGENFDKRCDAEGHSWVQVDLTGTLLCTGCGSNPHAELLPLANGGEGRG